VGLRQQLADPWGAVAGAVTGLLAGAVAYAAHAGPAALAIGAGVAAGVYAVKAGAGILAARHAPAAGTELPRPAKGSSAEVWLHRSEKAVRTLRTQTAAAADPAVRDRLTGVDADAARTLDELRRVAAQVAAVDDAAAAIDVPRLQAERTRLVRTLFDTPDGPVRRDHTRAAEAVADQLAAYGRLREAREALVARLQATALGLEGVVARVAEVTAAAATAGGVDTTAERVRELTGQLDGFRAGLAATEALSRRVLGR
jgi:hypothetical protein